MLLEPGVLDRHELGVRSEPGVRGGPEGTDRLGVLNLLPSSELGEWISEREIWLELPWEWVRIELMLSAVMKVEFLYLSGVVVLSWRCMWGGGSMESSMTKQDSSTSESILGLLLYFGWGPSSIRWRSNAFSLSWPGEEEF